MRKCISVFLLFLSCITIVWATEPPTSGDSKTYIVYMGEKLSGVLSAAAVHTTMLSTVLGRDASKSILHNYKNFNGFVVKLTNHERKLISSAMKGIVSIFPSTKKHLHTTRSWDFMGFSQQVNRSTLESDIIVGVFDSGIWPESESFSDVGFGPPPLKWKGACEAPLNFTCNNKLIGARFYKSDLQFGPLDIQSPRDDHGHGTHTASTAAGGFVSSASLSGLALGTARGGVPTARIAAYKVCWTSGGCEDADILAAFDDAISDGVDIISLSVGGPAKHYFEDGIAIGTFHAMKNGILTVASAGNSGPDFSTTSNVAPWFMSVAASSIDRTFLTSVELGNNVVYSGVSVNTFDLNGTMYPLIYGGDAPNFEGGFDSTQSGLCADDSLDPSLVSGKIVLCDSPNAGQSALTAGAAGAIAYSSGVQDTAFSAAVPYSSLGVFDGVDVFSYMQLSSNPTATIFKSTEGNDSVAPYVVSFSSRGPNPVTFNILKPDISAPGNDILAAWSPIAPLSGVEGDSRAVQFNIQSGTSMSCPHVSGVAAYIKSYYPLWSPAAIKSALMTTASRMDDTTTSVGLEFSYGAGHLNPLQVLDPGLVYDAGVNDYINFLCGQKGYDSILLQRITGDTSTCTSPIFSKDLNLPSFALAVNAYVPFSATFNRKVTNVGPAGSTYQAKTDAYTGVSIKVVPSTLSFSSQGETLSFVVTIQGTVGSFMTSNSLIWSDGVHNVRSPIVVYTV